MSFVQPALVQCEGGCGNKVSIEAVMCPHCGKPYPAIVTGTGMTRAALEAAPRQQCAPAAAPAAAKKPSADDLYYANLGRFLLYLCALGAFLAPFIFVYSFDIHYSEQIIENVMVIAWIAAALFFLFAVSVPTNGKS